MDRPVSSGVADRATAYAAGPSCDATMPNGQEPYRCVPMACQSSADVAASRRQDPGRQSPMRAQGSGGMETRGYEPHKRREGPEGAAHPLGWGAPQQARLGMKRVRSCEGDELALDNFMHSKRYLSAVMASSMTNLKLADGDSGPQGPSCNSPVTPVSGRGGSAEVRGGSGEFRFGSGELRSSSPLHETPTSSYRSASPLANGERSDSGMSDDSMDSGTWAPPGGAAQGSPENKVSSSGAWKRSRAGSPFGQGLHGSAGQGQRAEQQPFGETTHEPGEGEASHTVPLQHCFSTGAIHSPPSAHARQSPTITDSRGAAGPGAGPSDALNKPPLSPAAPEGAVRLQRMRSTSPQGLGHAGPGLGSGSAAHMLRSLSTNSAAMQAAHAMTDDLPVLPPIQVHRSFSAASFQVGSPTVRSSEQRDVHLPPSPSDRNSAGNLRRTALMRAQHKRSAAQTRR